MADIPGAPVTIDLNELERKLDRNFLPSPALTQILSVVNNARSSAGEIEQALKYDPGFTLKILKLSNSAYYGARSEVANIRSAIVLLGLNVIKSLAVQAGLDGYFQSDDETPLFSGPGLWQHSVGVGIGAKMICRRLRLGNAEDYFTLGILHDIGLMIENKFYPEAFLRMAERLQSGREQLCRVEREIFGLDHAILARRLCEKWAIPSQLSQCVQFHHDPMHAPEDIQRCAAALYLANQVVKSRAFGFSFPGQDGFDPGVPALLGLEPVDIEVLQEDFSAEIKGLPLFAG